MPLAQADLKAALAFLAQLSEAVARNDPEAILGIASATSEFYTSLMVNVSDPLELEGVRIGVEAVSAAMLHAVCLLNLDQPSDD